MKSIRLQQGKLRGPSRQNRFKPGGAWTVGKLASLLGVPRHWILQPDLRAVYSNWTATPRAGCNLFSANPKTLRLLSQLRERTDQQHRPFKGASRCIVHGQVNRRCTYT